MVTLRRELEELRATWGLTPATCRSAQALDDHGHALAAADAHRLEAEGLVGVLEAVEQGGHDAGPGLAEGVAEGDGAAVDVELVPADARAAWPRG